MGLRPRNAGSALHTRSHQSVTYNNRSATCGSNKLIVNGSSTNNILEAISASAFSQAIIRRGDSGRRYDITQDGFPACLVFHLPPASHNLLRCNTKIPHSHQVCSVLTTKAKLADQLINDDAHSRSINVEFKSHSWRLSAPSVYQYSLKQDPSIIVP